MGRFQRSIPDAEWAVLQLLWDEGPTTVRRLTDVLYPRGGPSEYATVHKLLEHLTAKALVRRQRGKAGGWSFQAAVARDDVLGKELEAFVEKMCGGSLQPLLTNLVPREAADRGRAARSACPGRGARRGGAVRERTRRRQVMNTLLELALSNALLAGLLAVLAAVVGVVVRRPALSHSLWLLVLLKLATPSLLPIPVPWPQADEEIPSAVAAAVDDPSDLTLLADPTVEASEGLPMPEEELPAGASMAAIPEKRHAEPEGPSPALLLAACRDLLVPVWAAGASLVCLDGLAHCPVPAPPWASPPGAEHCKNRPACWASGWG